MNFRYFACPVCRKFSSAGYRWAYWQLEHTGLVTPNSPVDIAALLAATSYWSPPVEANSLWLYKEVLPCVKTFLYEHTGHGIIFVDSGDFFGIEDFDEWIEIKAP